MPRSTPAGWFPRYLTRAVPSQQGEGRQPSVAVPGIAPNRVRRRRWGAGPKEAAGGARGSPCRLALPPRRPRRGRRGDDKGGTPVAIAEDIAVIHDPQSEEAFHVEQHGVDFIPESERWATPRHIFGMWAGASVQVEYFIYGCILMSFGFSFGQALSLIIVGNLSFFLLGLCSLQGPQTGTTVFAINRAAYGPNGSRPISFFNWLTQIGFEVEGLILIVGAGLVLMLKAGFKAGHPAEAVLVVVAVLIQGVLPFLGHATIVKTLRVLTIPFVILFAVLLGFAVQHGTVHGVAHGADWQTYMEG